MCRFQVTRISFRGLNTSISLDLIHIYELSGPKPVCALCIEAWQNFTHKICILVASFRQIDSLKVDHQVLLVAVVLMLSLGFTYK
jgi:hypothetical protein